MTQYSRIATLCGRWGFASLAVAGLMTAPAQADWKPTKRVEIVVHTGEQSDTTFFARQVIGELEKMLPKGVKIVHIRGGGGDRARRTTIKNKGNAHYLQVLTPSQINNPLIVKANYGVKDFTPVAIMVVSPMMLAVNGKSPYKSLKDIIDRAGKEPGKVIQGGGDFGETDSLHGKMLSDEAKVKINFTPFKDKGIIQLLGGHVDFVMANPAQLNQYVKSGDFRLLVATDKLAAHPALPTFGELGYKFGILRQYRGLWMPPAVSKDAVAFWIKTLDKVRQSPKFTGWVEKNNAIAKWIAGDDLKTMLMAEEKNYFALDSKLGLIGKKKKKK